MVWIDIRLPCAGQGQGQGGGGGQGQGLGDVGKCSGLTSGYRVRGVPGTPPLPHLCHLFCCNFIFIIILMLMLAVTQGVTHVGVYHCPSDGHFYYYLYLYHHIIIEISISAPTYLLTVLNFKV